MNHDKNPQSVYVQSDSIWLAERQQLHIDLQPLLNQPGRLILTSWDVGIRWLNVIDGETTTVHTDPFSESLFPIEFIDHDLLKPWVPDRVRKQLRNPGKAITTGRRLLTDQNRRLYRQPDVGGNSGDSQASILGLGMDRQDTEN